MYSGNEFQIEEAAAGKARLSTVNSLTDGTMRRLVAAERKFRRPGTSATRVSSPRYRAAQSGGQNGFHLVHMAQHMASGKDIGIE